MKLSKGSSNQFSISECPKTIERVDENGNGCTAHLNVIASGNAGTCKYGDCIPVYGKRVEAFAVNGFANNFGTIEDQLRYSNSIGSWFASFWQKTKDEIKKEWQKLKQKEQNLKAKVQNLFHKKNKTQSDAQALADAQAQLQDTQKQLADLQAQLDVKDEMLSGMPSAEVQQAQDDATRPSWDTTDSTSTGADNTLKGNTPPNKGGAPIDSGMDTGAIIGLVVGIGVLGLVAWGISKEIKSARSSSAKVHAKPHW